MNARQIDNGYLASKLALRRHLLARWHKGRAVRVLNCCEGEDNVLWGWLRREVRVRAYLGLDLKKRRLGLRMDSARFLAEAAWRFDMIDIDTYGSPFAHLMALLDNFRVPAVTVAWTWGLARLTPGGERGNLDGATTRLLGLDSVAKVAPVSLLAQAKPLALGLWLTECRNRNILVHGLCEALPSRRARYLGARLERKTR